MFWSPLTYLMVTSSSISNVNRRNRNCMEGKDCILFKYMNADRSPFFNPKKSTEPKD